VAGTVTTATVAATTGTRGTLESDIDSAVGAGYFGRRTLNVAVAVAPTSPWSFGLAVSR
jgi:hypothetical protein